MHTKIYQLYLVNIFLKIRIWIICKLFPLSLNHQRTRNQKIGYKMTFFDDFETLDKKIWQDMPYYGFRYHPANIMEKNLEPFQYFDSGCVTVEKSILKLECNTNPIEIHHIEYDGKDWGKWKIPYRLGWLQTLPKTFSQKHGYFEIRSKAPNSGGTWPAFWLASTEAWPPEIDIFEIYTSDSKKRSTSSIHWGKEPKHPMNTGGYTTLDLSENFSVFGCEWSEKYIKIFYGGWLVRIFPTPDDFNYEMNIIINNGVETDEFGKNRDQIISPNYFEVDYVKVWRKL